MSGSQQPTITPVPPPSLQQQPLPTPTSPKHAQAAAEPPLAPPLPTNFDHLFAPRRLAWKILHNGAAA
ncbi:hypothetical protein FRC01_011191, partial [Tulasnella sp. 417]